MIVRITNHSGHLLKKEIDIFFSCLLILFHGFGCARVLINQIVLIANKQKKAIVKTLKPLISYLNNAPLKKQKIALISMQIIAIKLDLSSR